MNKNDILQQLIEGNNGYLLSAMVSENNISKAELSKYVKEKGLERVARGIYITDDVVVYIVLCLCPSTLFQRPGVGRAHEPL